MSKQKIVVTGGAGYLGSILVPELLAHDYHVTVVDNFMYGQHSLGHVCANNDFEVVRGDVRDERLMAEVCKKADIIIPLAALVGAPLCERDPIAATTTNRDAIVKMALMLGDEQKILMPVTNSGYGIGQQDAFCTEESPLNPISLYGRDKVAAEGAILGRKNSISFRLATVFGMSPRMRIDLLVNDFTYRAVFDGTIVLFESHFRRNYIHVRDVTRAFLHGLNNFEKMRGEAYNVGLSDANLSKKQLAEKIKEHIPSFAIIEAEVGEDPDKRDYIVSNEKIEKTGYQPAYSLDMGIKELIKGYTMIKNTKYTNI